MEIIIVGTNHKHSPIEIREKLYVSKSKLRAALLDLVDFKWIKAAVILSTCNRVELYAATEEADIAARRLKAFLSDYHQQDLFNIEPYLYTYIGKQALAHLFNVSCGLDSQILGETQILEQVRFAFEEAKQASCIDNSLETVFSSALRTGARVHSETALSKGNICIGSIVLDLIKEKIGSLKDKKILIIGVGKVSELVTEYLKQEKVKALFFSNRSLEKAKELAEASKGIVLEFSQLKEKLKQADVIISATRSPHLILSKQDLVFVNKPLLIIDLALPRDIDPQVKDIRGIELYCLDDLNYIIEKNLDKRESEIFKAADIIEKETQCLWSSINFTELAHAQPALP